LPKELWSEREVTFLDPACKSGVFLREIAKRLDKELENQIPDRQQRINHIFKHQLYGLTITELTALLSFSRLRSHPLIIPVPSSTAARSKWTALNSCCPLANSSVRMSQNFSGYSLWD